MQCNAIQFNSIQFNATQRNAMQCYAMQCNVMQCNACNACNAMVILQKGNTITINVLSVILGLNRMNDRPLLDLTCVIISCIQHWSNVSWIPLSYTYYSPSEKVNIRVLYIELTCFGHPHNDLDNVLTTCCHRDTADP